MVTANIALAGRLACVTTLLVVFLLLLVDLRTRMPPSKNLPRTRNRKDVSHNGTSQSPAADWEVIQQQRISRVEEVCSSLNTSHNCPHFYLLADDLHKVIFCFVPKVACTVWRNTLLALHKNWPKVKVFPGIHDPLFMKRQGMRILSMMSRTEVEVRLRTYSKFLFVRSPLERLVSAYRSKFEDGLNDFFNQRYGREIIKLFRKNATAFDRARGDGVTFSEYVQYATTGHNEPHWAPYENHCCMCRVHYDYIGKFETFREDSKHILQKLFNKTEEESESFLPTLNTNPFGRTGDTHIEEYMSQLPGNLTFDVNEYYKHDLQMFQYDANIDAFNSDVLL